MDGGLIRDVTERHHNSSPSPFLEGSGGSSRTGFPVVQHRSKATSAFRRARQDDRVQRGLNESRERLTRDVSTRVPNGYPNTVPKASKSAEDWMADISRKNEEVVSNMGAEERAREKQDIIDKFGDGIEDLMVKVRESRERRVARLVTPDPQEVFNIPASEKITSNLTPPSPRARTMRKIRFAEPTEADVHVYESQPSSPKRTLALLPPPEELQERGDISSLGTFQGQLKENDSSVGPPTASHHDHPGVDTVEEGTPEDIRRRFFPSEMLPEANPALAWMLPPSAPHASQSHVHLDDTKPPLQRLDVSKVQEPRYSLSGIRLTPTDINNLPTHFGLHHHAALLPSSDTPAGYTLSDLLLLSRSSVPAQRASILGVLTKLLRNTREYTMQTSPAYPGSPGGSQLAVEFSDEVNLNAMRRDMLDVVIDALGEKGGVGQRGVELLWEATVGFIRLDYGVTDLDDLARVDLTVPKVSGTQPSMSPPLTLERKTPAEALGLNFSRSSRDIIMALPVTVMLPMLRQHLLASTSAQSRTYTQVLEILLLLSHFETHARTIVHADTERGVISVMLESHIRSSFGLEGDASDSLANPTSISILQAIACSSRDNAMKLAGAADVLLRYIIEPRPIASAQPFVVRSSMILLEETLRFYGLLSQYGLYSQIATIAQDHFAYIGEWIIDAMRPGLDPAIVSFSRAYVNLLGGLIVCATNPHQTTPNHDILWSQVQGWGWAEWILKVVKLLALPSNVSLSSTNTSIQGLWADLFRTIAIWVEGASVNGVKGGEKEREEVLDILRPLFQTMGGAQNAMTNALDALQAFGTASGSVTPNVYEFSQAASLVEASTRLLVAGLGPGEAGHPFRFPSNEIQALCVRLAINISSRGYLALFPGLPHGALLSENACVLLKPLSTLMVYQLRLWRRYIFSVGNAEDVSSEIEDWIKQAFRVLRFILPGDEEHAQWIVESLCHAISPRFVGRIMPTTKLPDAFQEKDGMNILLPFFLHSLRPASHPDKGPYQHKSVYIAPIWPSPQSISQCTTLNSIPLSILWESLSSDHPATILPMRNDWPMLSLNHLLRSGTSPVFHALPPSWDASETDVVRASLLLARVAQELGCKGGSTGDTSLCMSSAQVIFACMKVIMLEHGQQEDSGEEVFRDAFVTRWMEDLLQPFTYSRSHDTVLQQGMDISFASLERASKAFLGTGTPFYQFYTDFLALYDAISFAHSLFARLLLPPVSMSYHIDYRKLLFGDFNHILRTVKTDLPNLLCGDVRDYLWPVERDAHMIGWYLKLLISSQAHGFLRWFTVHHVAANIWQEFTKSDPFVQERAGRLLDALLQQGKNEDIRDIVLYRQQENEAWEPPHCFAFGEVAWRKERLAQVQNMGGQDAKTRLQSLLLE